MKRGEKNKNSGVTGGGQGAVPPPETSDREISADLSEKRGKENMENGAERKENLKIEGEKFKMEGGKVLTKNEWGLFFF